MTIVSVIMAVYNGENTVQAAIDSIINQDFLGWELIICDDASTDGTRDILSGFRADSRITVIKNHKNSGTGYSLNQCLKIATGKYIAVMDADDLSYSNRLKTQFDFMENSPTIDVLGSYASLFDHSGNQWGVSRPSISPTLNDWLRGSSVIHASVMMKKQSLIEVGGYDPKALRIEDYDLWLRMINKEYTIQTVPIELYSIHWSREDYLRKKNKYRLLDSWYRLKNFWGLGVPYYKYYLVLKPIVLMCIPKYLLHKYHLKKMASTQNV